MTVSATTSLAGITDSQLQALGIKREDLSDTDVNAIINALEQRGNEILFYMGFGCGKKIEPMPRYMNAPCETELGRKLGHETNAWIVLGRDRPHSRFSGYGGMGDSHAASMDLVVGRHGAYAKSVDENGRPIYADPNFKSDAARVYLSQKTDVDTNFGIRRGIVGNPRNKSAVAIKADGIRLIGREGIKLVTLIDDKNSHKGDIRSTPGIDLIAGNDDSDLQPMVKGRNLIKFLRALTQRVNEISGICLTMWTNQSVYNGILSAHTHIIPGPLIAAAVAAAMGGVPAPVPTLPSIEALAGGFGYAMSSFTTTFPSILFNKIALVGNKLFYLTPLPLNMGRYINSRQNYVN